MFNDTLAYLKKHPRCTTPWTQLKILIKKHMPRCYTHVTNGRKAVPVQILDDGVREAWQAVKNAKAKGHKTGQWQELRFQNTRSDQSMLMPQSAINPKGFYVRHLGEMQYAEELPPNPRDSRLIRQDGHWYLCIVYNEPKHPGPQGDLRVVALDPGVRDFLTYFTETGFGWLGHYAINRIQRLCHHLDRLLSDIATCTRRRKKRAMRRAANRIRHRIRNLVKELHCKLAHFIVTQFDVILLPSFDTSQMVMRGKRRIRKKSVRQMLTLSHYKFKQRLIQKAAEFGKHVIIVNEAYTSKTVSWIGEVKKKIGGSKIITAEDGSTMHRDLNGARGILVRFLTWFHALQDTACTA